MQNIFTQVANNKIFVSAILAWITAQAIKVIQGVIRYKRFDFRWLIATGGMPSTHTAGVSCLASALGIKYGFDSAYFAISAAFAFIVMFDAQGVRRAAGRQARILNKILEDIYWKGRIDDDKLRELVGHTPVEVVMGFLLGIAVAILTQ